MKPSAFTRLNYTKIAHTHKYLPHINTLAPHAATCSRCAYINAPENNFCTNCGYPLQHGHTDTLYLLRTRQRAETKRKCTQAVFAARFTLYFLSAFCLAGIGFFFSGLDNRNLLGILCILFSVLIFSIARWSIYKPFTALLAAFVIVLTFSTIFIFGEFTHTITTVQGVYTIVISMVLVYFLLRGVQGAYKADLINEEMLIN